MILRPYQTDLVEMTRTAFKHGYKRPLAVLPCGAGKTVCFADMAHRHVAKNPRAYVWFLVHRRELVAQTLTTFNISGIPSDHVMVGMVQTVARSLTTDSLTVARHPHTYPAPSLIIFDEAHHATATTWRRVTDAYPDVPVIGLTATPVRRDGTALSSVFDTLVVGAEALTLTREGYLAPYDYYAPRTVDMRTVRVRGADYDMDDVTDVMLESRVYGDVIKYLDPSRKTIIYCPSVRYSMLLVERLREAGIEAQHFDGTTPTREREYIVDNFRTGTLRVLTNVDLVGEGFDVPDCDTVMLLRPTQSLALYIQQSMRAMRPAQNKRAQVYDFVGNCYRHGMPTDPRQWTLSGRLVCSNPTAEPDVTCRRCEGCHLVYGGVSAVCPYCGHDNGKTRREIQAEEKAELERVEAVTRLEARIQARRQQGRAKTLDELLAIERERGYKRGWAHKIYHSRRKKI